MLRRRVGPRLDEALGLEVQWAGHDAILEDESADAEGTSHRERRHQNTQCGDQRCPRAISSRMNPSTRGAEHKRSVRGKGLLEVVVLCRSTAYKRPGWQHAPQVVDGGAGRCRGRPGGGDHLVQGPPRVGRARVTSATPDAWARMVIARGCWVAARPPAECLEPGSECAGHLVVADSSIRAGGTMVIDGMLVRIR